MEAHHITPSPQALSTDSSGFVMLSEAVPDCLQDIRYHSTYNFVGARIRGYEQPCALLTREAATALGKANEKILPLGLRLKVFDAYRPQTAVNHFIDWSKDPAAERMKPFFYPDLRKQDLFPLGFICARSGHSRGSTVDLTIFDMTTGISVDMGSPFDFFGARAYAECREGLSERQIANRRLLRDLMVESGFEPFATEWWHFTLADEPFPDTYFDFPVKALS